MAEPSNAQNKKIESILIVDDDAALANMLEKILAEIGYNRVDIRSNGEEGFKVARKKHYDLILIDWKIPKVSGAALLNRLRRETKYHQCPIIAISGYIGEKDFALLEEFPLTIGLEKPFTRTTLQNAIKSLTQEQQWFTSNAEEFEKLSSKVKGDTQEFLQAADSVLSCHPNPSPIAIFIGRHLRERGQLDKAEQWILNCLKRQNESLGLRTELAKVYLQTNRLAEAEELLKAAQRLSPINTDRLCLLGKSKLHNLQTDEAKTYFEAAMAMDPTDSEAAAGRHMAIQVESVMGASMAQIPRNFASMINTIGISHVRKGELNEGIKCYQTALKQLFNNQDKARIAFNLGLAYFRHEQHEESMHWFNESVRYGEGQFLKGAKYLKILKDLAENPGETPIIGQDEVGSDPETAAEDFGLSEAGHHEGVPRTDHPQFRQQQALASDLQAGLKDLPDSEPRSSVPSEEDLDFTNLNQKEVMKELQAPQTKEDLISQYPEINTLLNMLRNQGEYLDFHVSKFIELAGKHSDTLLRPILKEAINKRTPSARKVEEKLRQRSKGAAAVAA